MEKIYANEYENRTMIHHYLQIKYLRGYEKSITAYILVLFPPFKAPDTIQLRNCIDNYGNVSENA